MKIITTPMCEDLLKIAQIKDYTVVSPKNIENADIAILLSETESSIPKISVKLNTYKQVIDSIKLLEDEFNSTACEDSIKRLKELDKENDDKKINRKPIKVKVYSRFLSDTVSDMGYTITDNDYDYIVKPDYMEKTSNKDIMVASHKNVPKSIIERLENRYKFLENKLCMKQ